MTVCYFIQYYDNNNFIHVFDNGYIGYHCSIKNKMVMVKRDEEMAIKEDGKSCGHFFHVQYIPGKTKCPICNQLVHKP